MCGVLASCVESEWERYVGYTALGATEYAGPRTIGQCLAYCERTSACVGVDIDVDVVPLRCWPHLRADQLHPDNVYSQQGTSHYRLVHRCPNATRTTGTDGLVFTAFLTPFDKKVKFSHTRYRTLGPELIPVYRQSARR